MYIRLMIAAPVRINLTRHLYALLCEQTLVPDKRCQWPRLNEAKDAVLARRLSDGFKLVRQVGLRTARCCYTR